MRNKHPFWMKLDWRGARPLTLRELIMKSNFETMMKYIIAFDKKMVGLERQFYHAVEVIRDMKVKYNPEEILAQYEYGLHFGRESMARMDQQPGTSSQGFALHRYAISRTMPLASYFLWLHTQRAKGERKEVHGKC